ncbi:hypothetical protein C8Q74DRAFT_1280293 [Fomes fomentarius]|nr:hypothetical protein C8Q74DRAFT_1280293 [Fomes fomentarius]
MATDMSNIPAKGASPSALTATPSGSSSSSLYRSVTDRIASGFDCISPESVTSSSYTMSHAGSQHCNALGTVQDLRKSSTRARRGKFQGG